jgi:hypothetical protein
MAIPGLMRQAKKKVTALVIKKTMQLKENEKRKAD